MSSLRRAAHRSRAIGTLTGFTAVFVVCALALMGGQDHFAVGTEWAIAAGLAGIVYVRGYLQAIRMGGSSVGLGLGRSRLVTGTAGYVAEVAGAAVLIAGYVAGLYVAAVAMILMIAFMISGVWLLIVGVSDHPPEQPDKTEEL